MSGVSRHGRCAAAVLLTIVLLACDRKREVEPPPPVRPVLSLVVRAAPVEALRSFSGTVEPRYQAQLGFRIAGRMISRAVNVGDSVGKGQELAALDPTVQRLALLSAQADLSNAQAQATNALATFSRQQELIKTQSATQAQLDSATAARDTARARVGQAEAGLQKAQEQLGYTTLTSDYDGVIASWSVEVGQVVSAGQTVVTVARPDVRDAVFDVPDDLVGRFAPGTRFGVRLLADEGVTAQALVREVAPSSDPSTRTRRVRLTLENPQPAFRLGTTVRTDLAESGPPRILIPATAVMDREGGGKAVWLVRPQGTVALRPVTLAGDAGGNVTVASGLADEDRVVTSGVHSLSDGQAVKLEQPEGAAP